MRLAMLFSAAWALPALAQASAAEVASALHDMNVLEIRLGQLASERGSRPEVRRLGELLAADHRKADLELMKIARRGGIALDPLGYVERRPMNGTDRLEGLEGAAFDRAFLEDVVRAHREAIAELERVRRDLDDQALARLSRKVQPLLEQHLEIAESLLRRPGAG